MRPTYQELIENQPPVIPVAPCSQEMGVEEISIPYRPVIDASISTMWCVANTLQLEDALAAVERMGATGIELNHQLTPGMLKAIDLRQFTIPSVHDPCPADLSLSEMARRDWQISSTDEEYRCLAVEALKGSIDLASIIGAGTVVVHAGSVPVDPGLESRLRILYQAGERQTDEFGEISFRLKKARAEQAPSRMASVIKSLSEIMEYAKSHGVRLGLENRNHYADIPSLDELEELLGLGPSDCLGFVYDTGHGQSLDCLGFYPYGEWLSRFGARMIGVHLHDISCLTDHQVPGLGEINFQELAPQLPDTAFRTLEVRPYFSPSNVRAGLEYLVKKGCARCL